MKKAIFLISVLSILNFSIFGKTVKDSIGDSQKAYRDAVNSYDVQEYGKALNYAEDALLFRKQKIEFDIETLNKSLSSRDVRSVGDNLRDVLKVLLERKEFDSIEIINSYMNVKGIDYFDNSVINLIDYMKSLSVFPEAHKLIGDIYKLEGEYKFAEEYYLKALQNADVLDIPNEKYDILYQLAEISYFEGDLETYEIRLLNILAEDENYKNETKRHAMVNTIKGNNKRAVEKFFSLYRVDSYISLNAYIQLADLYNNLGEYEKALEFSALAVITSFTKINETLESRNIEYTTDSLSKFFQECSFYSDIVEWGNKNVVW